MTNRSTNQPPDRRRADRPSHREVILPVIDGHREVTLPAIDKTINRVYGSPSIISNTTSTKYLHLLADCGDRKEVVTKCSYVFCPYLFNVTSTSLRHLFQQIKYTILYTGETFLYSAIFFKRAADRQIY